MVDEVIYPPIGMNDQHHSWKTEPIREHVIESRVLMRESIEALASMDMDNGS